MALEDTADDFCALAYEAWGYESVRKAASRLCGDDNQRLVRSMLAIEIAREHSAHIRNLKLVADCR